MPHFTHIEKSAFRKGEYVAYLNGPRHIRKYYAGWETYDNEESGPYFNGRTLAEIDRNIQRFKEKQLAH